MEVKETSKDCYVVLMSYINENDLEHITKVEYVTTKRYKAEQRFNKIVNEIKLEYEDWIEDDYRFFVEESDDSFAVYEIGHECENSISIRIIESKLH